MSISNANTSIEIDYLLNNFLMMKQNPSYLIREKIYKKNNDINSRHETIEELKLLVDHISPEVLTHYQEQLNNSIFQIVETIDLILNYEIYQLSQEDLQRYMVLVINYSDELIESINNLSKQTRSDIDIEAEQNSEDYYIGLKFKIEDNIDQLVKTYSWKEFEEDVLQSQEDAFDKYISLMGKINNCKVLGTQLPKVDYLETISKMTIFVRDEVGKNFAEIYPLISMLESVCKLLYELGEQILLNDGSIIYSDDVMHDVDHMMAISKLQLLERLHEEVVDDTPVEDMETMHTKFAEKLYTISRDPTRLFVWTMSYLASESKDGELIRLSFKVANLSSILLTVVSKLESINQVERARSIKEMETLEFKDAIDDLTELYKLKEITTEHMRKAMERKLAQLKEILLEIIQFSEIAEEVLTMFQFDTTISDIVTMETLSYTILDY